MIAKIWANGKLQININEKFEVSTEVTRNPIKRTKHNANKRPGAEQNTSQQEHNIKIKQHEPHKKFGMNPSASEE